MAADLQTLAGTVDNLSDLRDFLDRLHAAWNDDPEVAHALEDEIKTRTLELVAAGHPEAASIAREVLVIDTWNDIMKWYA
jgi:hypothetical protein